MGAGRSKVGYSQTAVKPTSGATQSTSNIPTNATQLTDSEAQELRDEQNDMYDASTGAAIKMYISNTNFDNQGHSLSQTMNYLEGNGIDLNSVTDLKALNKQFGLNLSARDLASMQYTSNYMDKAVHPIGKDVVLQRGAHDGMLRTAFNIPDYSQYSESQLQSMLVGQTFTNTSYMSTSYDVSKNPFLSSSSGVSGGREIVYNIKAGANTKMIFGARAQSEIVLAKGTNFRITGVHYTGKTASPRTGASKRQLQIDIETY